MRRWPVHPARPQTPRASEARKQTARVLLAVAHGSRDPAAQQCVLSLTSRVARSAGGIAVRTAFVQNAKPSLAEGLDEAATQAGPDGVVVVPLLLSSGYHLSSDIAGAARAAGVPVARPLGPDPRLVRALSDRLREAGVPGQVPFYCPYCGDTDLRPDAPEAGSWRCASCARAFKLTFTGVVPASQASS